MGGQIEWFTVDGAQTERAALSGIRAQVYPTGEPPKDPAAPGTWVADVEGDEAPTTHPTKYLAKRAAERRLLTRIAEQQG